MVIKLKKRYILILSLILVILSMSCVSAGLFDGLFGGDGSDKNITLIKESVEISRIIYDDGEISTWYYVKGVFKDLPSDVKGYNLKISGYDENGKLIKDGDGFSMKSIAKSSKDSEPSLLGVVYDKEYEEKNISYIELTILDKDGKIVFDKNITFNLDTMDIRYETKSVSSSSDSNEDSNDEYHSEWLDNYLDNVRRSGIDKDN